MKASPSAPRRLFLVLVAVAAATVSASSQDAVVMKTGLTREGKITGVSGGNVRLQIQAGSSTGIPLAEIREVRMESPPEFDAATSRLAGGDAVGAVEALQGINDTYPGLPAPWARQAAALLGDAKLASGDSEGATAAYDKLAQTYPEATALANLGRARLAVEAGQFSQAALLLEPLLAASDQTAFPLPSDAAPLCQAHFLHGRVQEAAGDYQGALASYLMASALFPFDQQAAAGARQRADTLRAEHAGLIAP